MTDDGRTRRAADEAADVVIEAEVRVRVLDNDGLLVAETVVAERGGFALDPHYYLADQLASTTADLSQRAGDALDKIAQETAWGR